MQPPTKEIRNNPYLNYKYNQALKLTERVAKDLEKGAIETAIKRYEGFFSTYPVFQELHNNVATLYLQIGRRKDAGRHFYFKENPTEQEVLCIRVFEKSLGNCPLLILKKLIHVECFSIKLLNIYTKRKMAYLIDQVILKFDLVPGFLQGPKRHFNKLKKKGIL